MARRDLIWFLTFALCVHPTDSIDASFLAYQNIEDFEAETKVDQLLFFTQKRLAIMHEVAKAKWNQRLPIEDKVREENLLVDLAQKAKQLNLNEQWIVQFFQIQMDVAKEVQKRDFALWQKQGIIAFEEVLSLQQDLRSYIDHINQEIILLLSEIHMDQLDMGRFVLAQPISIRHTDSIDQDLWVRAISPLQLNGQLEAQSHHFRA